MNGRHEDSLEASMSALADRQGAAIRHLRTRAGWSHAEMASRADMDLSDVAAIEVGRRHATVAQLRRLAGVFGVAEQDLLRGHVPPGTGP